MITSKAPLRLSFGGGTTDFPQFFAEEGKVGRILGCTLDKYVHVFINPQPIFEKVKFRFTWRISESVDDIQEFIHPVVRETLRYLNWSLPINVATMADLPGRSGLGSSSSFTVALLAALREVSKEVDGSLQDIDLAHLAIHLERVVLREAGGWQDQFHAAVGGFRLYEFKANEVSYSENLLSDEEFAYFSQSLVLVETGGERDSHRFAQITQASVMDTDNHSDLVDLSDRVLDVGNQLKLPWEPFAKLKLVSELMTEGWRIKRRISGHKFGEVDRLLEEGMSLGALGGKLCGAGGSGFAAFFVPPNSMSDFLRSFEKMKIVLPGLSRQGAIIQRL
jgi:D-glycero-alpha-D-manno-heptose-7-phosphate kinase